MSIFSIVQNLNKENYHGMIDPYIMRKISQIIKEVKMIE